MRTSPVHRLVFDGVVQLSEDFECWMCTAELADAADVKKAKWKFEYQLTGFRDIDLDTYFISFSGDGDGEIALNNMRV